MSGGTGLPARWLVTGAGGMLGRDLTARLAGRAAVTGLSRAELDITDATAVRAAVRDARPDIVVNCAAWTQVDLAESREADALAVNGDGAAHVAQACAAAGARMIHLSTDYVFDGTARAPYPEDAAPGPATAYGRTKLAGERAVAAALPGACYILRSAWLYGPHGHNFVATMTGLAARPGGVTVVSDQHGQPTSTVTVSGLILALAAGPGAPPGIYHATCAGETTWYELARAVFALAGADPDRVTPIPGTGLRRPAPRPAYSVLGHAAWARAGLAAPEHWRAALHRDYPAVAATLRGASAG